MHHLRLNTFGRDNTIPASTSPAFDLFASGRSHVPAELLLKALASGWLTDPKECDDHQRSVLLAYLGTFENPVFNKAPDPEEMLAFNNVDHVVGTHPVYVRLALDLLNHGADPWAQDVEGRDSLDQAFSLQWWSLFDRLWHDGGRPAPAALMERTLAVQHVHSPASQHRATELPWLHAAVALGRETMLTRLLDSGFDVNQLDAQGRTPLFYAHQPSTVTLLLDRGVDVTVTDQYGRHVGLHWSTSGDQNGATAMRSDDLAVMNRLLQPVLVAQTQADPDAARRMQLPVLFEFVATNTKDNVVKHLRAHGFTADEHRTVDGQEVSLLTEANLAMLRDRKHKRGTAVAAHLFERVSDPWFESIPGVPDVMMAWLAACMDTGATKYLMAVEKVLGERYGWDQPGGVVRFLDDFLPAAQRLIGIDHALADPNGLTSRTNPMAMAVAAAELHASHNIHSKTPWPPVAQAWVKAHNAQGHAYAWVWASIAAEGCLLPMTPAQAHLVESNLQFWATGSSGTYAGDARYSSPEVPFDAMALHAMLVHLGHQPQPGAAAPRRFNGSPLDFAFQNALNQGVRLDSSLPGFEDRLARVREQRPELAMELERRVLNQEAKQAMPRRTPERPRSRL